MKKYLLNGHTYWIVSLLTFIILQIGLNSFSKKHEVVVMTKAEEKAQYQAINKTKYYFDLNDEDIVWVENTLSKLTIKEKAAQLVMPWAEGDFTNEYSPEYKRLVRLVKEDKVGGIIFFKGEIVNEAILINKLQKLSDIPLLISSDFERGLAMRLSDGLEFPYNMAVAAARDSELTYEMGKIIGEESRSMGVHQNYAPVADINNNPENPIINIRSFSEDKELVAELSSAMIKGLNDGGILSTSKHFPGHGNTEIDSHRDMPVLKSSRESLYNNELYPFIKSINNGVSSIMIGHLDVPSIDNSNVPASLSRKVITDLLKNELGYKGLIVTDAMNMRGITKYYSTAEAAVKAINAGVDLLLFPPDEEIAINAIANAVKNGTISEERIDESVRKLLAAKRWLKIYKNKYSDINNLMKIVNQPAHIAVAQKIADKSITLVKDSKNILPLNKYKKRKISLITINDGFSSNSISGFQHLFESEFGFTHKSILSSNASANLFNKALKNAKNSDIIIVPAFINVKAFKGTVDLAKQNIRFINKLLSLKKPVIILSFGNPYLLSAFPEAEAYLCAYGDAPVSQKAMIKALLGEIDITGKLPVSIPNTVYNDGYGIDKLMSNRIVGIN